MSFADIFKNSFLEGYGSYEVSLQSVLGCLAGTLLIAAYIFAVYRLLNRNTFYNRNFNISLLVIALITAAIILTIQASIVISLGMVGALSIVRFRTAVKDPMDLAFLFWAISAGIICGAGLFMIAAVSSLVITGAVLTARWLPSVKEPKILLVNSDSVTNERAVLDVVCRYCSMHRVQARNLSQDHMDMAIEVRVKEEGKLVTELMGVKHVTCASLIAHDGETAF